MLTLSSTAHSVFQMAPVPLIAISTGRLGVVSRIAGEVFGSVMTFAVVEGAPVLDQINVDELKDILDVLNG